MWINRLLLSVYETENLQMLILGRPLGTAALRVMPIAAEDGWKQTALI